MGISDFRALAEPADFTVLDIRIIFYSVPVKPQITLVRSGKYAICTIEFRHGYCFLRCGLNLNYTWPIIYIYENEGKFLNQGSGLLIHGTSVGSNTARFWTAKR